MEELEAKKQALISRIRELKKVAVAFSSGVDSTYLLAQCHELLGDNVLAITIKAQSTPDREIEEAKEFCRSRGIRHIICAVNQLTIPGFCDNTPDRCYICKKELFTKIKEIASENGIENVLEGSNYDDIGDYRPGMKAIKELGILSPLLGSKMRKSDIRNLSEALNLPTSQKPSLACLATRIAYGEMITEEKLNMIDKAELFLTELGIKQVRVRYHNSMARIEVEKSQFKIILDNAYAINNELKSLGFQHISLDLAGYKTGSMNTGI